MCGLVGMAGNICHTDKKMFRDMLVMDQLRGFDSTGILSIPCGATEKLEGMYGVDKDTGPAQNLWEFGPQKILDLKGYPRGIPKLLLGHNRAATIGKITAENAHPFEYGDTIGAHNGSLTYWKDLEGHGKLDVDSKALINTIDLKGIDHTWDSFWGAAALTYYNVKEGTLSIVRNKDRPLYIAWSKKGDCLYWASEFWMITAAAYRNKVELREDEKGNVAFPVPVDTYFKYKVEPSSCELVEERKLVKKYQVGPSNTGPTKSGTGGTITTYSSKNLKNSTNFVGIGDWKEGTKKAKIKPYEVSLERLSLMRRLSNISGDASYFRLNMYENNTLMGLLNIYPTNQAEFDQFMRALNNHAKYGFIYDFKLLHKPREKTFSVYKNQRSFVCSASAVEVKYRDCGVAKTEQKVFPLWSEEREARAKKIINDSVETKNDDLAFVGPKGELLDEEGMKAALAQAKNVCAYCNGDVDISDARKLHWFSTTSCLCPECKENWGGNVDLLYSQGA